MIYCKKIDLQKTIFPDKANKFIQFKNFENKIPVSFVVYADVESLILLVVKLKK